MSTGWQGVCGCGRLATASFLAVALLATGCGIDEYYTGMGEGALPGEPLNPDDPVVECGVDTVCACQVGGGGGSDTSGGEITIDADDLSGYAYRFDSLALGAPLPGPMADPLNQFFADEIGAGTLSILFAVRSDDRDARQLVADIGAGEPRGAGHALTGSFSEIVCELAGDGFTTAEPSVLSFPNDLLDPPELPLRSLRLGGTFSPGARSITGGVLDAALTVQEAAGITVSGLFDLRTLFENQRIEADLDLDGDGTNDAWRFTGTFSATLTTLVEQGEMGGDGATR